ncbi:hypothetical protein LL912_25335 [Niabella sp. CC-SYL272]|uniref:hypothetical protein n=1 Tax=Niabella agricola TaxID=2891571 RepID=UPI001F342453|nr:hypothetical protein [Niabella agricola]MCF3112136.1 hypothetical protein [Niabella agricola]
MKKIFTILAISSVGFIACNNAAEGDKSGDSTAVAPTDTTSITPAPPANTDTVINLDTNHAPAVDTTVKK